jgi:putative NADPH-quinone reductase
MKKTILEFCGIKPVRITEVGPVRNSTDTKRKQWIAQIRALGVDQA